MLLTVSSALVGACLPSLYSFWVGNISLLSIPLTLIYKFLTNLFQNLQNHLVFYLLFSFSRTSLLFLMLKHSNREESSF